MSRRAYLDSVRADLGRTVARLLDPVTPPTEIPTLSRTAYAQLDDLIRTVAPTVLEPLPRRGYLPNAHRVECAVCGRDFVPTIAGFVRRHEARGRPCPGSRTPPAPNIQTEGRP